MKSILLNRLSLLFFIFIFCGSFQLQAKIWHVSKDTTMAMAMFKEVNDVLANSSFLAGDTILLHRINQGSGYATANINKKVVLMGEGFKRVHTKFRDVTPSISTIYITHTDANESKFIGLNIGYLIQNVNDIDYITINHCRITNYIDINNLANNWIISENIINGTIYGSAGSSAASHIFIENNVFSRGANIQDFSNATVLIRNNVFVAENNQAVDVLYSLSGLFITNNIFFNTKPNSGSGVNNCTFSNNLFYTNNYPAIPATNNNVSATGTASNIFGYSSTSSTLDPAYHPTFTTFNSTSWDKTDINTYDELEQYNLHTNNPLYMAPNPVIGLHPSARPFALPPIPFIIDMSINNPLVSPNGTLNVSVTVVGSKE